MDDGGLEVDVEDAEHVDGVEGDAEDDQPPLAPPRGGRRRVRLRLRLRAARPAIACVARWAPTLPSRWWIWEITGGAGMWVLD